MREKWTDERLDDLNRHLRDGFDRIDKDLRALRAEMSAEIGGVRAEIGGLRAEIGGVRAEVGGLRAEVRAEVGGLRAEVRAEIGGLRAETNARFDSLQRTLLQLGGGMLVTFVVGFASLLVTQS